MISDIFYIWPNMQACASNITMLLSVSSLESFPQGGRHEYKYKYKYAASGHTLTRNRFNLTHNIYLYLVTISPVGTLMTLLFGIPGPRHSWMKRGLWSLPPFSVLSCKKNCLTCVRRIFDHLGRWGEPRGEAGRVVLLAGEARG